MEGLSGNFNVLDFKEIQLAWTSIVYLGTQVFLRVPYKVFGCVMAPSLMKVIGLGAWRKISWAIAKF